MKRNLLNPAAAIVTEIAYNQGNVVQLRVCGAARSRHARADGGTFQLKTALYHHMMPCVRGYYVIANTNHCSARRRTTNWEALLPGLATLHMPLATLDIGCLTLGPTLAALAA